MKENKSIEEIKEGLVNMQEHKIFLEAHPSTIRKAVARTYQPELIKHYFISELTPNSEGGFIVKLEKRFKPLTEKEYQKELWPNVKKIIWKNEE